MAATELGLSPAFPNRRAVAYPQRPSGWLRNANSFIKAMPSHMSPKLSDLSIQDAIQNCIW
eukprot:CAMPEP_0194449362 /NCGR_PEP_ID=MMETSP0176-20130528/130097_1 /TAXON_ID=216777 /ORGANISM="Proboscia alata, Strain PI-D3" /LENGTH=60 /DNA_ID=CAMNT_0039276477 /DNA_START=656 /DNA_END=838 /DNA_ORIENTATION=+